MSHPFYFYEVILKEIFFLGGDSKIRACLIFRQMKFSPNLFQALQTQGGGGVYECVKRKMEQD